MFGSKYAYQWDDFYDFIKKYDIVTSVIHTPEDYFELTYEYLKDWAAKGTKLLGIKAVIAESFERIHRSNLIGMGILPLQFINDVNRKNLQLIGSELISIMDLEKGINPSDEVTVEIKYASGEIKKIKSLCRIDTKNELEYYKNGGILQYVLRNMI